MKNKLFNLGVLILIFIITNILITSILFIFKISITEWNFIISSLLTFVSGLLIFKNKKYNIKESLISFGIIILIIFSCIFSSSLVYDSSYDGNGYHKVAVGQMKMGWNPVYQYIDEFNQSKQNKLVVNDTSAMWTDHYAKGYYMYAANTYSITNNIESGKSFNFLLGISLFLILLSYLLTKFNKTFSIIITSFVVFNPIFIPQIFSYYNDLNVASSLFLLITSLIIIIDQKSKFDYKFILFTLVLILMINIKFSAFGYAGIYSAVFFLYILLNKNQRKQNLKKIIISGVIGVLIGIFVIGLSTYVKNYIDHNHPFYPLYGKDKVDIIINQIPEDFYNKNRFEKFFVANFSRITNPLRASNEKLELKVPFDVSRNEIIKLQTYDLRIGGYGVWFSGILIISVFTLLYFWIFKRKHNKELFYFTLIPSLASILILILISDAWWARYFPQLYLAPIFAVIYLKVFKNKFSKILKIILLSILLINILFFVFANGKMYKERIILLNNQMNEYNTYDQNENDLIVKTVSFDGTLYNYYDINSNLKYTNLEVKEGYQICSGYFIYAQVYCKK